MDAFDLQIPQVSEDKTESEFGRRDQLILETVRNAKPKLFVNPLGVPSIMLPFAPKSAKKTEYPIHSARLKAELAYYICSMTQLVPHQSEINRILTILEGKAWRKNNTTPELVEAIDSDPMLEAVYIYINQPSVSGSFEGTCTKLLNELLHIANSNGIYMKVPSWPKGAAQLSHRLWKAKKLLQRGGIGIDKPPRTGPKRSIKLWKIDPGDAEKKTASQERHAPNAVRNQRLDSADAIDGAVGEIFKRIAAPEGVKNEERPPPEP